MAKKSAYFSFLALFLAVALGYYAYNSAFDIANYKPRIEIYDQNEQLKASFKLEIVDTPDGRQRGLMFRQPQSFAKDQAMLFVFPDVDLRTFWMKNTYIPLDIIYLDQNCKIVSVQKNVPILNEVPRPSTAAAKYVLEINSGLFDELGFKEQDSCKVVAKQGQGLPNTDF